MKLNGLLYYACVVISVSVTYVLSLEHSTEDGLSRASEKRISKREAAVMVINENLPGESITKKPRHFYKRFRYLTSKPVRGKMAGNLRTRKPHKKYKVKKIRPIYSAASGKKRIPLPWQPMSKTHSRSKTKSNSRPSWKQSSMVTFPQKRPQKFETIQPPIENESLGFGEPPEVYNPSEQYNQDILLDSYGAPFKINHDLNDNKDNVPSYDELHEINTAPDYTIWNYQQGDKFATEFSNRYALSSINLFENDQSPETMNINNFINSKNSDRIENQKYHIDMMKIMNKPWHPKSFKEEQDKVLVGGKYAEPPARYIQPVQRLPDANSIFSNNDELTKLVDLPYTEITGTISPYVNYKHSNMAFSPQNLNDAFSIDR